MRLPNPEGPLMAARAEIRTSLDFGDPPLRGELTILPAGGRALEYLVDLDGDGRAEESGPLGLGVVVGYEFVEAGPHPLAVLVGDEAGHFLDARTVVVNDPGALEVAVRRTPFAGRGIGGLAINAARRVAYATAPEADLVLAVDPDGLTEIRRLPVAMDDSADEAGGIAVDPERGLLYVDLGDSLARVDVSGPAPGEPTVFARADRGEIVERLPGGILLAGGSRGVLRIDPVTGQVLGELDSEADLDFEPDPEGVLVALASHRGIAAVSIKDGVEEWDIPLSPLRYGALSYSPNGDRLFALVRTSEEWLLLVIDAATGAIQHRYVLGATPHYTTRDRFTRPAARTPDGRYIAFATDIGALIVDATTGLPLVREAEATPGSPAIGCCNVVTTDIGILFAPGDGQWTHARIDR